MNRSKMHVVRQQVKTKGETERPLQVASKLQYAKLSLTESMMDFVCEGENIKSPNSPGPQPAKGKADGVSPNTSRRQATLRAKTGVPITKILPNRGGRFKFARINTASATDMKHGPIQISPEKIILHGTEHVPAEPTAKSSEVQDKYHQDMEVIKLLTPGKKRCEWVKSTEKPLVTLKTSPSGNNIKFSCTIDKRVFNKGASVAFQLKNSMAVNQHNTSPPINIGISGLTPTPKCSPEPKRTQSYRVGNTIDHTGDANITEYQNAIQAEHIPQPTRQLPILKQLREHSSGYSSLLSTASSSNSSCLSQENLLLYAKQNSLQQSDRKLLIDTWVMEVNEAQDMSKLLRGRERAPVPGKFANFRRVDPASKPEQVMPSKSPQKNLSTKPVNGSKGVSTTIPDPTLFSTYVDNLRGNKRTSLLEQAEGEGEHKVKVLAVTTNAKSKPKSNQKKLAASASTGQRFTRTMASNSNLVKQQQPTRKRKATNDRNSDQLQYRHSLNKDAHTEDKRPRATHVTS